MENIKSIHNTSTLKRDLNLMIEEFEKENNKNQKFHMEMLANTIKYQDPLQENSSYSQEMSQNIQKFKESKLESKQIELEGKKMELQLEQIDNEQISQNLQLLGKNICYEDENQQEKKAIISSIQKKNEEDQTMISSLLKLSNGEIINPKKIKEIFAK
ncbi:MAG: hypothetical protein ISN64_02520 [Rickettsia sp.]|nr:hypothetical protein [Rickettsia sp.]